MSAAPSVVVVGASQDTVAVPLPAGNATMAVPAPAAPEELSRTVHRALAKRPDDRYPTAEELAADLRGVHALTHVRPPEEVLPEDPAAAPSRYLTTILVAGGLAALLIGAVLYQRGC